MRYSAIANDMRYDFGARAWSQSDDVRMGGLNLTPTTTSLQVLLSLSLSLNSSSLTLCCVAVSGLAVQPHINRWLSIYQSELKERTYVEKRWTNKRA